MATYIYKYLCAQGPVLPDWLSLPNLMEQLLLLPLHTVYMWMCVRKRCACC